MILPLIPQASIFQVKKKIYKKLEDQVLTIQALNEKVASVFTEMKSDMEGKYSGYTSMRSDMRDIKTMITHIMSQKHHSSLDNIDSPYA